MRSYEIKADFEVDFKPFEPENLKNATLLQLDLEGDFYPVLEKLNTKFGISAEPRGNGYHVSIIRPVDKGVLQKLDAAKLEILNTGLQEFMQHPDMHITGIGYVDGSTRDDMREVDKEKKVCFVTLESAKLAKLREDLELPKAYFHVTLGFEGGDIHTRLDVPDANGKRRQLVIEKEPNPDLNDLMDNLPVVRKITGVSTL
ncbi:hypothetical protein KAZ57_00980 [Patescibacteria group bacterium]|nr:hypothetical protein [Patescibacteria group bacterium]